METNMKRLNPLDLNIDGCAIGDFPQVRTADFQAAQQAAFDKLQPGENAANKLKRAIAYGSYARDQFTWLDRNGYCLLYTSPSPRD